MVRAPVPLLLRIHRALSPVVWTSSSLPPDHPAADHAAVPSLGTMGELTPLSRRTARGVAVANGQAWAAWAAWL